LGYDAVNILIPLYISMNLVHSAKSYQSNLNNVG